MPSLSETVRNLTNVSEGELDKEIAKVAVITELDTVNMYEKMAEMTKNKDLRIKLLEVIRDKRMHVGELQAHLMQMGLGPEDILGKGVGPGEG